MFLGIHQDFRNDFDISNAVASFGKYIDWHRHDPLRERTLVYAAFPSPQTVPRDVVFGDYATVGGSRQGWTAACYVLTADFADAAPPDEDPMPLDGNPHPLPGNLQPMMHNFVLPPFPELGWNEWPDQGPQAPDAPQQGNVQLNELGLDPPMVEVVHDGIVLDDSLDTADSSFAQVVDMQHDAGEVEVLQPQPAQVLNVWQFQQAEVIHPDIRPLLFHARSTDIDTFMKRPVGPPLPPHMIKEKIVQSWFPKLFTETVPMPVKSSPFLVVTLTKRSWKEAFDVSVGFTMAASISQHRHNGPVARALCFNSSDNGQQTMPSVFAATPASSVSSKMRGKAKRKETPLVDTSVRRCTRSMVKNNGYRPMPVSDTVVKPRAKKAKKEVVQRQASKDKRTSVAEADKDHEEAQEKTLPPQTPIHILQTIGIGLGIDPALLTEEKLTANPEIAKKAQVDDD
jgi:hypothetical protein